MELSGSWKIRNGCGFVVSGSDTRFLRLTHKLSRPIWCYPFPYSPNPFSILHSTNKNSTSQPLSKPNIVQQLSLDHEDFGDDESVEEEDYFEEDESLAEDAELFAGDGGGGGGISLAGTSWDKEALAIAEEVALSCDGDLKIYAFKTLANSTIQVRIEKLSNRSGSPSMADIEAFSAAYRARLDEAEVAKSFPVNIALEVSSPGVERVVQIPQDLDRFKDRPMYVKYVVDGTGSSVEGDGVFRLISFDVSTQCCTWGLADVRVNREKAGKGRPLNKKQREWRLNTPFDSLRLVRLYSDI